MCLFQDSDQSVPNLPGFVDLSTLRPLNQTVLDTLVPVGFDPGCLSPGVYHTPQNQVQMVGDPVVQYHD